MKPLKTIIEGILGDLDKDLEDATMSYEFANHPAERSKPGWGSKSTKYDIDGDTLNITHKTGSWICTDNKFWELIKFAKIKHINCNRIMEFQDISFDIDGIFIKTNESIYIERCDMTIKNCNLLCDVLRISHNNAILDNVNITASGIEFICNSQLTYQNIRAKCKYASLDYDKNINPLKKSNWGNYIESLGAVKILPSDGLKVLNEYVDVDEDFVSEFGNAVERYNIYTCRHTYHIVFSKDPLSKIEKLFHGNRSLKSKIQFKNGWTGVILKN